VFHKHPDAKGVDLLRKPKLREWDTISVESTVDVGTKFKIIF
jgi:hypothetical protein